jgi:hypothetical protein
MPDRALQWTPSGRANAHKLMDAVFNPFQDSAFYTSVVLSRGSFAGW